MTSSKVGSLGQCIVATQTPAFCPAECLSSLLLGLDHFQDTLPDLFAPAPHPSSKQAPKCSHKTLKSPVISLPPSGLPICILGQGCSQVCVSKAGQREGACEGSDKSSEGILSDAADSQPLHS